MTNDTITHKIWKSTENIALIYVGSAAEFALVEENHWLFFTNMLPANPQLRFVETFKYNQMLILSRPEKLKDLGERIRQLHNRVEQNRDKKEGGHHHISNEAFKLVGYMLIDYGISGWEYLHKKKMSLKDKNTYYQDMRTLMSYMHINDLPENYEFYVEDRKEYRKMLKINDYTQKLYDSYEKDIGKWRLWIFTQFQAYFVPRDVANKLKLKRNPIFGIAYKFYPYLRNIFTRDLLEIIMLRKDARRALDIMEEKTGYVQ